MSALRSQSYKQPRLLRQSGQRSCLVLYSIPMAWRRRYYQKCCFARARLHDVSHPRWNRQALSGVDLRFVALDFDDERARKHKEELIRAHVVVRSFARSRRHSLLDDA